MKKLWHLILHLLGLSKPKQFLSPTMTDEEKKSLVDEDLLASSDLPDYVSPPPPHLNFDRDLLQSIDALEAKRRAIRETVMKPELLKKVIDYLAEESLVDSSSSWIWVQIDCVSILGREEFREFAIELAKLFSLRGIETTMASSSLGVHRVQFHTYLKRARQQANSPKLDTITTGAYR